MGSQESGRAGFNEEAGRSGGAQREESTSKILKAVSRTWKEGGEMDESGGAGGSPARGGEEWEGWLKTRRKGRKGDAERKGGQRGTGGKKCEGSQAKTEISWQGELEIPTQRRRGAEETQREENWREVKENVNSRSRGEEGEDGIGETGGIGEMQRPGRVPQCPRAWGRAGRGASPPI